jgi:hypothetical protein
MITRMPIRRSTVLAAGVEETSRSPAPEPPNPLKVATPRAMLATDVAAMVATTIP